MSKINIVFEALADSTRRQILKMLQKKDMTPSEIIESFNITKPALTHHLNVLKRADLVITQRKAQNIIYSLNMSVFDEVTKILFDLFKS